MRNNLKFALNKVIPILIGMTLFGCTHPSQVVQPDVSFGKDIIPIMQASCAISTACHSGTKNSGHNLDFDGSMAYNTILTKTLLNNSNPTAGLLYVEINSAIMPKAPISPLSASQTYLILTWIKQGAKNN